VAGAGGDIRGAVYSEASVSKDFVERKRSSQKRIEGIIQFYHSYIYRSQLYTYQLLSGVPIVAGFHEAS
jgi:hypothetical protein